jgi:hypothetical protein
VPEPEGSIPLSSFHGPRYEGFDRCHLRMAGQVHDVEGATRHRHVRQLNKGPARKFGSHQQVAANRDALARNSSFDSVKLFAKVQADKARKIRNVLVIPSGGGFPLSPGWRFRIV